MKDDKTLSRRAALRNALGVSAAALIPVSFLTGCGSKLSCDNGTNLSPEDLKNRSDNQYVDASLDLKKTCGSCGLFTAGGEKQCGTCKIVKGPINPTGNCKNWAAKT
jgi:hypothetical protein